MSRLFHSAAAVLVCLAYLPRPAAAANTATITVNVGNPLRTMDGRFFGLNTAIWDNDQTTLGNPYVVDLLKATEVGSMRYPGGSTSDVFHWATNAVEGNVGTSTIPDPTNISSLASWGFTFDDFASLAQTLGSQPFITANYGSGTPAEAAAWVQDSNISPHQYGFKYWEIGNECYGGWETDGNLPAHDAVEYATRFAQYYVAMKAVDPTIKLGMPSSPGEDDYANYGDPPVLNPRTKVTHFGWLPEVLTKLRSLGVTPDFLVFHYYPIYALSLENDANLLQASSAGVLTGNPMFPVATYAAELRQELADYLPETGSAVELDCTETNNEAGPPLGRQSTSLVDGLFMADTMGSFLQTEFQAVVWWDSFNSQIGPDGGGYFGPSVYGWRNVGDEGILYTDGGAYPAYYVFKLLGLFARGGDTVVPATSSSPLLTPYAVRHPDGSLSILVINKDPANTWTGTVSAVNAPPLVTSVVPYGLVPPFAVHSYGIPQDNAANPQSPTYGASQDLAQSTFTATSTPSSFSMEFSPYSATVLTTVSPLPQAPTTPVGQTLESGSTLVLTAGAAGATSYEWFLNGRRISDSGSTATANLVTDADGPQLVVSKATSLSAGDYTAVAVNGYGAGPASGAAAVSVVASATLGHMTRFSTRAVVGAGDNAVVAAFSIAGSTSRTVLVQAVGPALASPPNELVAPLPNPALSIHQARDGKDVVLYRNTGWGSNPVLLASATKLIALPVLRPGSADSELLVTLPPGDYTAVVASSDGKSSGVALCSVYELP
jgi:hypothetical protein